MRHILLFLLPLSQAFEPGDLFPSCLIADHTWEESGIYDISVNVPSPEACQDICLADSSCVGVTWLNGEASPFPNTCYFFSDISGPTIPCQNCVSGPETCTCTMPGECEILDDNLIEMTSVSIVDECQQMCIDSPECNMFTFLGEENHLRYSCFLYKSCEVFVTDCTDCTTGYSHCDICDFEDMQSDGSCTAPCDEGWTMFGDSCYTILNNENQQYDRINNCREECTGLGGTLGSIHSKEENNFVYNLLRPARKDVADGTFLGAKYVDSQTFIWDDGTPWDYENWLPDEPSGECVFMGWDEDKPKKWASGVCNSVGYIWWDCLCKQPKHTVQRHLIDI